MDLALTTQGDIALDENGDFLLLNEQDAIDRQRAGITLLVNAPDYRLFPDFGANLEDLIGRRLDKETLNLAESLFRRALPGLTNIAILPDHEGNSLIVAIEHIAFPRVVGLVFSLDEGLIAGEDGDSILHEYLLKD